MNLSCDFAAAIDADTFGAEPLATVKVVNPLQDSKWDERLSQHPGATPFHSAAWARVLHQTYGFRPFYVVQAHGNGITGLLPLMEVRNLVGRRRAVSLPFTDACPLLSPPCEPQPISWTLPGRQSQPEDTFGIRALRRVRRLADERAWTHVEFRPGVPFQPETPASVRFFNHTVNLCKTDEAQLAKCEPAVRRSLRKAQSGPLRVTIGTDPGLLKAYFSLHCLTRRRQGAPTQPMRFFNQIQRELLARGLGFVVLAFHESRAVAGAVFLHFGNRAVYKFGASDLAMQQLRPNQLVMWTGLRQATHVGCSSLDLGRTSLSQEGLRRFKQGWGATETLQAYHRCDTRSGREVPSLDRVGGWQTVFFRWLPVWVSRWAGHLAYRYVA